LKFLNLLLGDKKERLMDKYHGQLVSKDIRLLTTPPDTIIEEN